MLMLVSQFRDDGIGVTVGELSKVLTSRGHRVTIGAFHFDRPTPDNVGVFALPRGARMKPWMLLHVFGDFDVIHHHQSAPLGISSFLRSGRFVSSFHGIPGLWQSHKYAALAEKLSFSASSRAFRRIIVPLACVQASLENQYHLPISKIRVIHPGVNRTLFNEGSRDSSPRHGPRLLYVGDLVRHKRVHLLIHALARCRREMNDSILTIVGDGKSRRSLEELVRTLGIERAVTFVGRIPNGSLPRVYRASDLYVTASATEAFGLPLLEAMACGVPVLASPCPAHVEILSASCGGETADPQSPEEFSRGIRQLYKERTRYAKNAVAYASEHSWARTCELTEALYFEVLSLGKLNPQPFSA